MYTFGKQERLCSSKLTDALFSTGHKFLVFVDRNRVKRLTRECYRLHKPQLYQFLTTHNLTIALSLNYIHNEIFDYQKLDHKVDRIIETLIQQIESQPVPQDNQAS